MTGAIALFVLFVAATAALWTVLVALTRPSRKHDVALSAVASFALAPALLAYLHAAGLRWRPAEDALFYPQLIAGVLICMIAACGFAALRIIRRVRSVPPGIRYQRSWIGAAVLAGATVLVAALTFVTPLYENDALEYATIARLIAEHRSLDIYPAVDSARTGGFYGPWTHPAGFPALLALAGSLTEAFDLRLMRIPSLLASVAMLLLLGLCGRGRAGIVAMAVMFGTPLFLLSTINTWVDPTRVAAGFAALVILVGVLGSGQRSLNLGSSVALSMALGLTFFMHSIGIVVTAMCGVIFLVFAPGTLWQRCLRVCLMSLLACAVVAPDLLANLRNFGAPVADSPPLWKVQELGFRDWMLFSRNLYHPEGKLINGLLMGFTQHHFYGVSYVLAAIGATVFVYRRGRAFFLATWRSPRAVFAEADERTRWLLVGVSALVFWFGCSLLGLALGTTEFIKNIRYPFTVQPLVVLIAGIGLAPLFERAPASGTPEP